MDKDDLEILKEEYEKIIGEDSSIEDLEDINYDDALDDDTKRLDDIKEISDIEQEEVLVDEKKKLPEEEKTVELLLEKNKKTNKKKWLIISLVIVLLLLTGGITIWLLFFNKKETVEIPKEEVLSKAEQKRIINNYGEALEGIIAVYYEKQKVLLEYDHAIKLVDFPEDVVCKVHKVYDDGLVYLNKCSINKEKTSYSYGEKQEEKMEEVEGDIKVYVNKKNKEATLVEPKMLENYDTYSFSIDGAYSELTLLSARNNPYVFYYDENYNVHMINFKTREKALKEVNYDSILPIKNDNHFNTTFVGVGLNDKWGIYNLNTGNCVVYPRYDHIALTLAMGTSGPPLYIESLDDDKIAVFYNGAIGAMDYTNGQEIIPIIYSGMLKSGNYLFATDSKNRGHILDYDGNEYLTNYNAVYGFVEGKYALVNDRETIKMVSLNGGELYNYGKIKVGDYNFSLSYNDGALFQFSKTNNDYQNCLEFIYNPSDKKGEVKDSLCGGIAKPVLYMYPKKKTNIEVSFEHPEYLETTYPKFRDKWQVVAHSDGSLYDNNGKYYYALYWDEKKVHSVDFSRGYYVEAANAIEFLEQKLSYIGLNEREMNEFIMYWLPILERNKKSLVYFELTKERESYNKLYISPKPDSLLRLTIHIKKVEQEMKIRKQNLTKFQRKGFVAVEWGGTVY